MKIQTLKMKMARRKAFTTIELLLATALAVVVMTAALRVVGSIRLDQIMDNSPLHATTPERLVDLVRWDLAHARYFSQRGDTLKLVGYGCLDRGHFDARREHNRPSGHQPVEIEYSVWQQGDDRWLIRRQTHMNELTNINSWTELVCGGIERFELRPVDPAGIAANVLAGGGLIDSRPVPDRMKLIIDGDSDKGPRVDTLIVLR